MTIVALLSSGIIVAVAFEGYSRSYSLLNPTLELHKKLVLEPATRAGLQYDVNKLKDVTLGNLTLYSLDANDFPDDGAESKEDGIPGEDGAFEVSVAPRRKKVKKFKRKKKKNKIAPSA